MESEEITIRGMIAKRSEELRNVAELQPPRISEILLELNSLNSNLAEKLADAEGWYKERLRIAREEHKSAADAKIYAESSVEYKTYRSMKLQWDALQELIRSCKLYMRIKNEEYKNTL